MNTDDHPRPDRGAGDRRDPPPGGAADPSDRDGAADPSDPHDGDEVLDTLAAEVAPPAELRSQVVERLRAERLLGAPATGTGWLRWALAAAALVVAFVAGRASTGPAGDVRGDEVDGVGRIGAGERGAVRDATPAVLDVSGGAWALLLYEDARFDAEGMSADELVAAYAAWARDARDAGMLVLAEKLGDVEAALHEGEVARRPVVGGAPAPGALTGLFVVRAPDEQAALQIARETPHHRLGGTVVVRAIGPT